MLSFLLVGCGGAVGAILRYSIGLIPIRSTFPVLTLAVNFFGAAAIGWITAAASAQILSPKWTLFWKTGVCGGFTTFSTFSLESAELFQSGKYGIGLLYVVCSVAGCLLGVLLGGSLWKWSR